MRGVVIEVGPAVIRGIGDPNPPPPMGAVALRGIDDPVVLWAEGGEQARAVDVDELLRAVLRAVAGDGHGEVILVYPSWWPAPRVTRLLAAAPASALALTRSAWIRQRVGADAVVVEVAEPTASGSEVAAFEVATPTAVSTRDTLQVRGRPDPDWIRRAVGPAAVVFLDDPQGRAGGIRRTLRDTGIAVHPVDLDAPGAPAEVRPVSRRGPAVAATVLLAALALAGLVVAVPRHPGPPAAEQSVSLVEGRLAVQVPAGWSVRRVTGGPGSARVEVRSPTDPTAVLHLTTSHTPQTTLTATAAALNRAAAALPRDVFSEVSAAELGGRPVLAYRENRPGRTIRWAVLLDGDTRIAIGCQSAAGRDDGTRPACERAISSAREVTGTESAPVASN